MNVLIVYAHEEPKSFNGAMRDTAVRVLKEVGHTVEVSDLYAIQFNPVGGKQDFTALAEPAIFKYGVEQTKATEAGTFAADVAAEQEKLLRADLLIFQFPMWWFGLPAILKGWVDRVFAAGLTYGGGRWYSQGVFKGKRAMLSLTTGGGPTIYSPTGLNGEMDTLLFPIQHGMLYFLGFDVLPPFIAWSVARSSQEEREKYLRAYTDRLRNWRTSETIPFPPLEEYDETLQRKQAVN
ncbi:NAD(P)H-dependent oxidoreductase [bacterium]|nr:NAD(P)H-dependent oxidoreductase [bacterium]